MERIIFIEQNYIGQVYGCYEIISETDLKANDNHKLYNCRCIHCGTVKQMQLSSIKYKEDSKCTHYITIGNIKIKNLKEDNSIPNYRLWKIFIGMLKRCYDIKNKCYRFYGEKGIKVYQRWIDNPRLFYEWAMENGYTDKLTIDRIQDNGNYYPENCRWVLPIDNARYKSTTNYITATVTLSGRQWAELIPEHSINYINKMIREQGKDKTIEYIEKRFADKRLINT